MNLISTVEAAARLGIVPERIRQLIRAGRLPAKRIGRDYLIREGDLRLVEHRPTGRPPWKNKRKKAA